MSLLTDSEWKDFVQKARAHLDAVKAEQASLRGQLGDLELQAKPIQKEMMALGRTQDHLEGLLDLFSQNPELDPERTPK